MEKNEKIKQNLSEVKEEVEDFIRFLDSQIDNYQEKEK